MYQDMGCLSCLNPSRKIMKCILCILSTFYLCGGWKMFCRILFGVMVGGDGVYDRICWGSFFYMGVDFEDLFQGNVILSEVSGKNFSGLPSINIIWVKIKSIKRLKSLARNITNILNSVNLRILPYVLESFLNPLSKTIKNTKCWSIVNMAGTWKTYKWAQVIWAYPNSSPKKLPKITEVCRKFTHKTHKHQNASVFPYILSLKVEKLTFKIYIYIILKPQYIIRFYVAFTFSAFSCDDAVFERGSWWAENLITNYLCY